MSVFSDIDSGAAIGSVVPFFVEHMICQSSSRYAYAGIEHLDICNQHTYRNAFELTLFPSGRQRVNFESNRRKSFPAKRWSSCSMFNHNLSISDRERPQQVEIREESTPFSFMVRATSIFPSIFPSILPSSLPSILPSSLPSSMLV